VGDVIPDKIQDAILQGGPWAALFLLSILISGAVITVMWKALREADARSCETRVGCDAEIKQNNEERIRELRTVVDAMNAYNRVMTDHGNEGRPDEDGFSDRSLSAKYGRPGRPR
jgi:hypothetical protein